MLQNTVSKTSRIYKKTIFPESVPFDDFFQNLHELLLSSSKSLTKTSINIFTAFFLGCPKRLRSDCINSFSPCSSPFSFQTRRLNASINASCDSLFSEGAFFKETYDLFSFIQSPRRAALGQTERILFFLYRQWQVLCLQ